MKKLLTIVLGLGLLAQQAHAATVTETVTGEMFAGYADSVLSKTGTFLTDLGNATDGVNWSSNSTDIDARITDTSAGTNIVGTSNDAAIELGFSMPVINGDGDDLKLFFVGNNGHKFDVTIGGVTQSYSLAPGANATGFTDPSWPTDPVIAMGINLSDFSGLTGSSFDRILLTIGNGYCADETGPCSAVPSFIGATHVVPVPAAVWLFGSGLLGLGFIARNRRS